MSSIKNTNYFYILDCNPLECPIIGNAYTNKDGSIYRAVKIGKLSDIFNRIHKYFRGQLNPNKPRILSLYKGDSCDKMETHILRKFKKFRITKDKKTELIEINEKTHLI